jgi:hypothetical protein
VPLLETSFAWSNQIALRSSDVIGFLSNHPNKEGDTVHDVVRQVLRSSTTTTEPPPSGPYQRKVYDYGKHLEEVFKKDLEKLNTNPSKPVATSNHPAATAMSGGSKSAKDKNRETGPSRKKQKAK